MGFQQDIHLYGLSIFVKTAINSLGNNLIYKQTGELQCPLGTIPSTFLGPWIFVLDIIAPGEREKEKENKIHEIKTPCPCPF